MDESNTITNNSSEMIELSNFDKTPTTMSSYDDGSIKKKSTMKSQSVVFNNKIDFSFRGINHFVSTTEKRDGKKTKIQKQILFDVNANVRAGEVLAILGPSGAGKTTLLDIIAHRLPINGSGKLLMNGTQAPFNVFKKLSGYVTQSDTLTAAMTVRETLSFYAQLKMPRNMSMEDKMKKVDEVIWEMGLKKCQNTLVGNDRIRGISGGERRRVTIAIELLTGPSILFLDEPTSGLDSSTSLSVIKAIRRLADSGRTVICTIHQPRSTIYEKFDKLLLLGDGSTIYYGDSRIAVDYFRNLGYECDPSINPADFFMDLINTQVEDLGEDDGEDDADEQDSEMNYRPIKKLTPEEMSRLKKAYTQSDNYIFLKQTLESIDTNSSGNLVYEKSQGASWGTQYRLLLRRELLNIRRNPMASRIQIMNSIFQGLLAGLVYYQLGVGQTSIQSRTGILAFIIMGISFPGVMQTIQSFPEVIQLFLKDRASGVYGTLPFFLAKSTTDVGLAVLTPILFGTIAYWMSNQRIYPFYGAAPFFKFLLVLVMAGQVGLSLGVLISSSVPSVAVGTAVGPLIVVLLFLFSGFFVNLKDLPSGWIWFPYISYFKYIIEAGVINAFTGVKFTCTPSESIGGECPTQTGEQVIERMGYHASSFWRNIWIVLLFIIAFRVIAFSVLCFKSRDRFKVQNKK